MRRAEVRCLDISYLTTEKASVSTPAVVTVGADGIAETTYHEPGVEVSVIRRAAMGEIVELSGSEWDRLERLEAIQEPGSAPLGPTGPALGPSASIASGWESGPPMPFNAESAEAAVKAERKAREAARGTREA